jgi:hypothetical protein
MRKSVVQAPTAGKQTQQKPCRTSSDIGAELESHTVGRGPTYDRKGLSSSGLPQAAFQNRAVTLLLALQSLVDLSLYQNCPPLVSTLVLTSPVPNAHVPLDHPQRTQATST